MTQEEHLKNIQTLAIAINNEATKALVELGGGGVIPPPVVDTGAPKTYPNLVLSKGTMIPNKIAPPAKGLSIVDPQFPSARIWRVTDDGKWGTLSAPNQNQVSCDEKLFFAAHQDAAKLRYFSCDLSVPGTPFSLLRQIPPYSVEPTFSRTRPEIVYFATHFSHTIWEENARTGVRTMLFDVQDDVGPLVQDNDQYMGSVYSSQGASELLVTAYGWKQDKHPYVTILSASNSARRITLNVTTSQIKVNGGSWVPLLNHDGTPANLNYGIHSCSIDRSGDWVRIDVIGNIQNVFFHVPSRTVHQWPRDAGQYTWGYGHYTWGNQQIVRAICGPGDTGEYQWMHSDMVKGVIVPPSRKLITKTNTNDQRYDGHPNSNNARMDGIMVPILDGTERAFDQTHPWQPYDDELLWVASDPGDTQQTYRIGHHRCPSLTGDFYETPRPQAFPKGRACLFTSHWMQMLSHKGNDLFLATF